MLQSKTLPGNQGRGAEHVLNMQKALGSILRTKILFNDVELTRVKGRLDYTGFGRLRTDKQGSSRQGLESI